MNIFRFFLAIFILNLVLKADVVKPSFCSSYQPVIDRIDVEDINTQGDDQTILWISSTRNHEYVFSKHENAGSYLTMAIHNLSLFMLNQEKTSYGYTNHYLSVSCGEVGGDGDNYWYIYDMNINRGRYRLVYTW